MSKPLRHNKVQIPQEMVGKLLTSSEWRMLKNRFYIANLFAEGLSIRKIAQKAKVGTDTVVRTKRIIERNNLRKRDQKMGKIKTSTPWIFGKSDE